MELRLYSSVFLVNDRAEVLLVREGKEINKNLWNMPGGKVEVGEDFLEAAIREAKEETGLAVRPMHVLHMFHGMQKDSLHCVFYAEEHAGNIAISDANILDVAWTPLADIPAMMDELVRPEKFEIMLSTLERKEFTPLGFFASPRKRTP